MNILRKLFGKTKSIELSAERIAKKLAEATKIVDPMIGKTVIHFTTHGCMATIHEFDYIGVIVDSAYPEQFDGKMVYVVDVLKSSRGEKRDGVEHKRVTVASWYLQNLGGDFYIAYD